MFMAAGSSDPLATFAGVAYVCRKFGVSPQAVSQRLARGNFPVQPVGRTVGGHILWRREDIDRAFELLKATETAPAPTVH